MRWAWLAVLLTLAQQPVPLAENSLAIEGTVVRFGTSEPLEGIEVTLIRSNPSLKLPRTPELQIVLEDVANVALRRSISVGTSARVGIPVEALSRADAMLLASSIADGEKKLGVPPGTLLPPEITTVTTDALGKFSFRSLLPGLHLLRAEHDGYFGPLINGFNQTTVVRRITLSGDQASTHVEFGMTQGGMIRGRVLDPDGRPVANVQVQPSQIKYETSGMGPYPNGRVSLMPTIAETLTDRNGNGEFWLPWLPPGRYYVEAAPPSGKEWMRTLFPNAKDPSTAVLVTVSSGVVTEGIEITFRREERPRFTISGTAVNPLHVGPDFSGSSRGNNTGIRPVSDFALAPREPGVMDPEIPPFFDNVISRPENGEFEIHNVLPGKYDLYAVYMGRLDSLDSGATSNQVFFGRTPVEVRDEDVKDIHMTVSPGVDLDGEIVINGSRGNLTALNALKVNLRAQETMPLNYTKTFSSIYSDSSGKFHSEHLPEGKFKLSLVGLPEGAYIEDVRQGGRSVFDDGFGLYGQPDPVQVVVNFSGNVVEGAVENVERKSVPHVTVVLVPPEQQRRNPSRYRTAIADESGKFSIKTVPPGIYIAYAWEGVLPYSWLNDDFYSKYQGQGKILNVVPNSRTQLQLLAIPADER